MDFLLKKIEQILRYQRKWKKWQKVVASLACIVVFITTYALILPAITMDRDEAQSQGGISWEDMQEAEETVASADAQGADQDGILSAEEANLIAGSELDVSEEQAEMDVVGEENSAGEGTLNPEAASERPAAIFDEVAGDVTVHVEAPEGAFPVGTTMKVEPVEDAQVMDAVQSAVEDPVTKVSAVDIIFLDASGNEIEPAAEIKVSMSSTVMENVEQPVIVHVDEEGVGETVESEQVDGAVVFESDRFSVYVIVGTETITVDYLTKDGSTYEITVDLTDVTNIPKEADLAIRELNGDEYDQYLADAAAELGVDVDGIAKAKLFDISIKNGEDEIQPNGTVKVDIKLKDETFEKAAVVHFGEETEVLYADVAEDVVSFETTGFSIYAIVESDGLPQPPRVTFEFSDPNNADFTFIDKAGHEQTTQIIKDGEKLQDVGLPTIPEGETFNGWFIYNGETPVEAITFDSAIAVAYGEAGAGSSVSASGITIDPNDLNEDGTYHVQVKAFFGEVVYLTFYEDAAGTNILNRIQIAKGSEYNIATQTVTAPNSELAFQGWNETAGTNDDDREAITSTTMTFNADDSFYPIFKSGHWITFYAGATGSGADYTAPVFVIAGDTASSAQPSNPEWKGYAFQYWTETNLYTGANDSYVQPTAAPTRFDFNSELNEAKTLYAYWTPADTTYTVVFWRQNVTDNKNAADTNSQTYAFAGQETKEGTTGSSVNAEDYSGYKSEDGTIDFSTCYDLNSSRSDSTVEIKADGTSVINVYFDRQMITMRFYQNGTDYDGPNNGYDWNGWTGTNYVTTYTGLYGQTLEQNGYSWPANKWNYYNNNGGVTGMTFLGQFVLPDGVRDESGREIRLYYTGSENASSIEFYLQDTDGSTYPVTANDTGTGTSTSTFYFSEKYDGFEVRQYRRYYLDNNGNKVYINENGVVQTNPENAWANAAVGGSTPLAVTVYTGNNTDYIWQYSGGGETVTYTNTRYKGTRYTTNNPNSYINRLIWNYSGNGSYSAARSGGPGGGSYYYLYNPTSTTETTGTQYGQIQFSNGNTGYVQLTRVAGYRSVNCILEVRYERKHYSLKYLDSVDNTELSGINTQDVVYGASLSEYEPDASFVPVSQYPGKVWDGKWYKNQACTEEFDWSVTMPNDNMVVYAGWEDVYYKVDIDPNGGTLTEGESTLFWRTYGQTVQRYDDVVRDYAEDPNGNYKYEDFLRSKYEAAGYDPWNYDGYLRTARYVSSDTTTTVPMVPYEGTDVPSGTFTYPYDSTRYSYEKGAYALIGWYELTFEEGHYGDLNYVTGESLYNFGTGVTHDTYIQAKWRRVGEYHVEYKPNVYLMDADGNINTSDSGIETTNLPSDGFSYADQSQSSIMRSPDSPITRTVDGESKQYVFQGWYYNGQLYTPGDVFTVLSSLAEDKVIGQDEATGEDIIQKTVYLYPVYQSVDDLPVDVTHIYWYSNWQDTDGNAIPGRTEENQLKDETNNELQPNEAVDIDYIDKLLNGSNAYEGYTFLGWAKSPTARTPWLTYNSETGKFSTVKDGVTYDNVTQVAADEVLPYEDLYAVWEINKYTVTITKTVSSDLASDQNIGFTFRPVFTKYTGGSNFILAGEETTVTGDQGTFTYEISKVFENVPYGSTLNLTESAGDYFDVNVKKTVTTNADGSVIANPEEVDSSNGADYTISGDVTIAYTNTRKTTDVTIKKVLVNPFITDTNGVDFTFTADWGASQPTSVTVNSNNTDGVTINNVPAGVAMVITETADTGYEYTVTAVGTGSLDEEQEGAAYSFIVPLEGDTITFTNTVATIDGIAVTKTDDKTPATGLSGANFTLTRNSKLDGSGTFVNLGGDFGEIISGTDGVMITANDNLPLGVYRLKENSSPDGYIITNDIVEFQITKDEEGNAILSWTSAGKPDNATISDDGKTLTITNQTGQALPHTGGPGTLLYTLSGIALMLGAALMYGFRMRRRERRLN